jgi:hypothetical protein
MVKLATTRAPPLKRAIQARFDPLIANSLKKAPLAPVFELRPHSGDFLAFFAELSA